LLIDHSIYSIEFKASRRQYFTNPSGLELDLKDWVIVEAERGEDMGFIYRILDENYPIKQKPTRILRPASSDDMQKLEKNREMEQESMTQCLELVKKHDLIMKLVDVEYQFDCNKLTFYFTADQRVDFRAMVKDLAATYRTRIELRQIGVRDEARRIGGFGVCGLTQCCNSFIENFEPISTQLARDQNLSLNPAKISGNCGRLLCCLMYEQDHYTETMKKLPQVGSKFEGLNGQGVVIHVDVFNNSLKLRHSDGEIEKLDREDLKRLKKRKKLLIEDS